MKPLRILAIVNLPWDPRLGAARVWIELAEEWRRAGHSVEKFCLTDAYPQPTSSRVRSTLRQALFPWRAAAFVRRNAERFDVIDCLIGTLPFTKRSLRFRGLLVARSVGLYRLYEQFQQQSRKRWPDQPKGRWFGRLFHRCIARRLWKSSEASVRHCDLLNVPNEDESDELEQNGPLQKPALVLPYGLSDRFRQAFAQVAAPAEQRLRGQKICFIGMWHLRKGSRDWPLIMKAIWERHPAAEFAFLGTMVSEEVVRSELGFGSSRRVTCLETYNASDLPALLADGALALFPSYIEGFGLAVLEQLAAGLPTVAYDVPGPRQILHAQRATLLTPVGDPMAMAARACAILALSTDEYEELSSACMAIARGYRWSKIAAATINQYREKLLVRQSKSVKETGVILQIVPRAPGGRDGVGDYAQTLALGLEKINGCKTAFISAAALSGQEWREHSGSSIVLHYVNYGYQRRGVPLNLLSALRQLRGLGRGNFVTIFHELYASAPPWKSAFWLRPFQIHIARQIARCSDACIVSNQIMHQQVCQLAPHARIAIHPVFSNFGEPVLSREQIAQRDPHRWVICGGTGLILRSLRSFRKVIGRVPEDFSPNDLFVVGGSDYPMIRALLADLSAVRVHYHPEITAAAASEILSRCAFAWLDYFHRADVPTSILLKSTAFAACCAHAVICVLPQAGSPIAAHGDVLPGPYFVERTRASFPPIGERSNIAARTYKWYRDNASVDHLACAVADLLDCAPPSL